jgi:YfiH family protein
VPNPQPAPTTNPEVAGIPMAGPGVWRLPWEAPGVQAALTTRAGGVSHAPYDSLNLGSHVGDDTAAVQTNRQRVAQGLSTKPVWLNQVHGTEVTWLDNTSPDGLTADGVCSLERGVACTIMVADCLPVLLSDSHGQVVAAAHAGWRGLAGHAGRGILDNTGRALRERAPPQAELRAWLGPCIGPQVFEVGPEVVEAFVANGFNPLGLSEPHPARAGKYLLNLCGLARQRLQHLGVRWVDGNDGSAAWCTVTDTTRWFSHRRDRVSGRLAALIWRT